MKLREILNDRTDIVLNTYFVNFARIALKRWNPTIIVITGSVGKTTMLNILESEISDKANYTHHANSAIGIAFDILKLPRIYESRKNWITNFIQAPFRAYTVRHRKRIYIVEADIARPRRAQLINKLLTPDISIWVSLSRSHPEHFEHLVTREKDIDHIIASEFGELVRYTKKLIIYPEGNRLIRENLKYARARKIATTPKDISPIEIYKNKSSFTAKEGVFTFDNPMPLELATQLSMVKPLMTELDIGIKYDLTNMAMPPGRNSYFRGKNRIDIIDSTYNAQLESMESMFNMLEAIEHAHKWVILGDMIEQGNHAHQSHETLAELIMEHQLERIILVGKRMQKSTLPYLEEHGVKNVEWFSSPQEALAYIEGKAKGGELMLFKGSQYLDWIIRRLLLNPEDEQHMTTHDIASQKLQKKRGLL